jgi:hypothetical protein
VGARLSHDVCLRHLTQKGTNCMEGVEKDGDEKRQIEEESSEESMVCWRYFLLRGNKNKTIRKQQRTSRAGFGLDYVLEGGTGWWIRRIAMRLVVLVKW